jgi:two-component system, NarL family, nitrate/nitrite response regulator NarL
MDVLIADDHELLAQAVAEALSTNDDFSVAVTTSLNGVLVELDSNDYDIVLLDLRMPGMTGLSSIERILKCASSANIVLFTGQVDRRFLDDAVGLGVRGYIPKTMPLKSLDSSLKLIQSGQTFIPHNQPQGSQSRASNPASEALTEREMGWLPPSPDGIAMCQDGGVESHEAERTAK